MYCLLREVEEEVDGVVVDVVDECGGAGADGREVDVDVEIVEEEGRF